MSLKSYARKRDFRRTTEPGPALSRRAGHRFVVQKHAASRLHYDFRLEMDGTLKSWAVPKGIPTVKGDRRLAVHVEDHPVAYIDFEGNIPKGQYGGGTVMVWDFGTFEVLGNGKPTPGRLHFELHGAKLRGEWHLVQMRKGDDWLIIRAASDMKPISGKQDDTSALSGRTMAQIAASDRTWNSNRKESTAPEPAAKRTVLKHPWKPTFIEPMKARLVSVLPEGKEWVYEVKFDGYRTLAFKEGKEVRLLSRNGKDLGGKFHEVSEGVSALGVSRCVLDGEIVALDSEGRSSFHLLQALELGEKRPPLFYYAFDLLQLEGEEWLDRPIEERKERLEGILKDPPPVIRYSPSLKGSPTALLSRIRKLGLEGLIGKRLGSTYEPGRRSGAWIKIKLHQEQEFVIGGYTAPGGSRQYLGALLIGYQERSGLRFAGKVGTGFDSAVLQDLHGRLEQIRQVACPFLDLPEKGTSRAVQALTAAEMKRCRWVKPVLVCQIRFSNWTRDGKLRQPVYVGLREDKDAAEVVREMAP